MFKFTYWCLILLTSVAISYSINVKCIHRDYWNYSDNKWCTVQNVMNFKSGDQLNLVDVKNRNEIKDFYLSNLAAMKTFPSEIFDQLPSLEIMRIENVGIELLTNETFKESREKLFRLTLLNTKVKIVPSNLLALLPNLKELDLKEGEIMEIENEAFASEKLKEVYLERNKLTSIKGHVFIDSPSLRVISLAENSIEEIEDGAFDLPQLTELYLEDNRLKVLPPNLFANTPSLCYLFLQSNQLTDVVAIEKAQSLLDLYLNDNPTLQRFSLSVLNQLPNLRWLELKNVGLTDLSLMTGPPDATELRYLYLSRNNLNDNQLLHQLSGFKKLNNIDLSENNLSKLDDFDKIREIFPDLFEISLTGNQWECEWVDAAREICEEHIVQCSGIWDDCRLIKPLELKVTSSARDLVFDRSWWLHIALLRVLMGFFFEFLRISHFY